jgi:hypothetical protein
MSQPHQPDGIEVGWNIYPPIAYGFAPVPETSPSQYDIAVQKHPWMSKLLHFLGIKKPDTEQVSEVIKDERTLILEDRLASFSTPREPKRKKGVIEFSSGRARIRIPGLDT